MSHKIVIAVDYHEAEEFAAWLDEKGHEAAVGNDTGNYVEGTCTSNDEDADTIINCLWEEYCSE